MLKRLQLYFALLVFTLVPAVAFAADGGGGSEWVKWIPTIVGGVVAIVAFFGLFGKLRGLIDQAFDWLAEKTKVDFLGQVDEILVGLFMEEWDAINKWLNEATADGVVTKQEWAELWRRVKGRALPFISLEKLRSYVGDPENFLESRAPKAAAEAKRRLDVAKAKIPKATPKLTENPSTPST